MALIQSQLDNAINNIIARFTGQYISFPDGRYHGECTAPIVWFFSELSIPVPPMFGNRADGWGRSFPNDLLPYFQHEEFQPGKHYPRGTILMWNSPHIALVTGSDGSNTVQVFEQNADPDGAPCKVVLRIVNNQFHACTYAMVPIVAAPAPAGPPYTITQVDPYKRDVLAGHQKWDLNQPNFEAVRDNPILTLNQQTTITVAAELHHHAIPQYTYLLEDPNVPQGYNQLDTVAYVVPAPPYVPPAGGMEIKLAEHCILVTTVPFYASPSTAQQHRPKAGELPARDYFVYKTEMGMKELTTVNGTPSGKWINPSDNVLPTIPHSMTPLPTSTPIPAIEPEPTTGTDANTAWKQYYTAYPQRELYLTLHDYTVADIGGSWPAIHVPRYDAAISLEAGRVYVYGTFVGPDGIRYYRLKHPQDVTFSAFYGVPILDHDGLPILRKEPTIKPATAAPVKQKASNKDTIHLITSHIEEGIPKFIDILPRWYKQINKQKGNK